MKERTVGIKFCIPLLVIAGVFLSSCAAKVTLTDRSNGNVHFGQTGSTARSTGNITAVIEDKEYRGSWIYSASGGSVSFGSITGNALVSSPTGSAFVNTNAFASGVSMPTHGNTLINMRSVDGEFIRCNGTFSSSTMTGIGHCIRNDGREFDLAVSR
jgi:hypothetical protein